MKVSKTSFNFPRDGIINRGTLTFWFNMAVLTTLESGIKTGKRGKPFQYSDAVIYSGLVLRTYYNISFRFTETILGKILDFVGINIKVPNHATLYYRHKNLGKKYSLVPTTKNLNVVINGNGLHFSSLPEKKELHEHWQGFQFKIDEMRREITL